MAISLKSIRTALAANQGQRIRFSKVLGTESAGQELWGAGSMPPAGSWPTVGAANGIKVSKATTGALALTNAAGGKNLYLSSIMVDPTIGGIGNRGQYGAVLVDRLAQIRIACTQAGTGVALTNMDATDRLVAGEGAQIWPVWQGGSNPATKPIWVFNYISQSGASKSTAGITFAGAGTNFNAVQGTSAISGSGATFIPLAQGDWGVRSITSIDVTQAGTAGSDITLDLVKPLLWIPVAGDKEETGGNTVPCATEIVCGVDTPYIPRIPNNANLSFITFIFSKLTGELRVVSL